MPEFVEDSSLDLRYETFRMRNPGLEEKILCSIRQRGIEHPLAGVDLGAKRILLDGFKRLRCTRRLGIHTLPYDSWGHDPVLGIGFLLRGSNPQVLSILEEARFVDELSAIHGLTITQIAEHLSCSKGWVAMRLNVIAETTPVVLAKLLSGQFPVYAYLYTLRPFMRMNPQQAPLVQEFVLAVSGKSLSVREAQHLFQEFVAGDGEVRELIRLGRLDALRRPPSSRDGYRPLEAPLLDLLQAAARQMRSCLRAKPPKEPLSPAFAAEAALATEWILKLVPRFLETTRRLHAQTRPTAGHLPAAPAGHGPQGDLHTHARVPQHRPQNRQGTGPSAGSQAPTQS